MHLAFGIISNSYAQNPSGIFGRFTQFSFIFQRIFFHIDLLERFFDCMINFQFQDDSICLFIQFRLKYKVHKSNPGLILTLDPIRIPGCKIDQIYHCC